MISLVLKKSKPTKKTTVYFKNSFDQVYDDMSPCGEYALYDFNKDKKPKTQRKLNTERLNRKQSQFEKIEKAEKDSQGILSPKDKHESRTIRKFSTSCGHLWEEENSKRTNLKIETNLPESEIKQSKFNQQIRNDRKSKEEVSFLENKNEKHRRTISENPININIYIPKEAFSLVCLESKKEKGLKKKNSSFNINLGFADQAKGHRIGKIVKNTKEEKKSCFSSKKSSQSISRVSLKEDYDKKRKNITETAASCENIFSQQEISVNQLKEDSLKKRKIADHTCLSERDLLEEVEYLRKITLQLYEEREKYLEATGRDASSPINTIRWDSPVETSEHSETQDDLEKYLC